MSGRRKACICQKISTSDKKKDWDYWIFSHYSPIHLCQTSESQYDRIYRQSRENVQPSEQLKFSPFVVIWGLMNVYVLIDLHMMPPGTAVIAQYYVDSILNTEF